MFKSIGASGIVNILEVGLSGFAFLLALMAFRLISREQKQKQARQEILIAANRFGWQVLILAIVVGVFGVVGVVLRGPNTPNSSESTEQSTLSRDCILQIERIETLSHIPTQKLDDLRAAVQKTAGICIE